MSVSTSYHIDKYTCTHFIIGRHFCFKVFQARANKEVISNSGKDQCYQCLSSHICLILIISSTEKKKRARVTDATQQEENRATKQKTHHKNRTSKTKIKSAKNLAFTVGKNEESAQSSELLPSAPADCVVWCVLLLVVVVFQSVSVVVVFYH